jgi:hypothetical protein
MKLVGATFGIAAMCAVGLCAQTSTTVTRDKTKIEVKDGKDITISGCLERNPAGGYMLLNDVGDLKYALVTDDDLTKHVGERVEVKGKATDRGDAKLRIESKVKGTTGEKAETTSETKTEVKGDLTGLHYLGLKSLKKIASSCR